MLWRAVIFGLVFVVLQLSWQTMGTSFGQALIHDAAVGPAVAVVNLLTPSVHAVADGHTVRSRMGSLNIINGCDGTEALFLLTAAFVAARLPWRVRLGGFLLGIPVVFVVNEMRILALFYANLDDRAPFDFLHGTATPIAVILLIAGYFYAVLSVQARAAATR